MNTSWTNVQPETTPDDVRAHPAIRAVWEDVSKETHPHIRHAWQGTQPTNDDRDANVQ